MKELIRRLSSSSSQYEPLISDGKKLRRTVSEGHVPVYVGEEMERFEVRTEHLGHPIFIEFLQRSAQEYGYDQQGVLRIPCPVSLFERVLDHLMKSGDHRELSDEIKADVLRVFGD